jgi:hypothetical protein
MSDTCIRSVAISLSAIETPFAGIGQFNARGNNQRAAESWRGKF